ncbi:hypothetical protein [Cohaesibacter celericrescens]|uniref:Uncharacterized protein n=1 Tax=Cohaesibacter celericrescens TaxID=2067669 RepID=A0A2N5XLM5_9HYPH|nr:hypothetical protein [Cohaesibacter celericrescens]PLW75431.1 hypothetical protein C0081_20405 [Cohaesibacter celericrescens]
MATFLCPDELLDNMLAVAVKCEDGWIDIRPSMIHMGKDKVRHLIAVVFPHGDLIEQHWLLVDALYERVKTRLNKRSDSTCAISPKESGT